MSVDGIPSSGHVDDTRAATASQDGDRRAEHAVPQQASRNEARAQQRPESLTREEYADAMRRSAPSGRSDDDFGSGTPVDGTGRAPADDQANATVSVVTHFHSEFKGRPMDLYTDGTRWAAADQVGIEDTVGGTADIPDPSPSGEELVDSAGEDSSRLERFRRELYKSSDDAVDAVEKDANLVHDSFSRPPTSSYQVTPVDKPYISEAQHSGIDAGSIATAVFVLGLVIDRGVSSFVQHYKEHARKE